MKKTLLVVIFLALLILAFFVWWKQGTSPVNRADKTTTFVVVPKGMGLSAIAKMLEEKHLIQNQLAFIILVKKQGLESKIQAGDFKLSPSMSAFDIAQTLTHGMLDIWVTIPEGKRAGEIANILKASIPSYQPNWKIKLEEHEGYLFPDTYLIPKDALIDMIITLMTNNFDNKYKSLQRLSNTLTKVELVTLASLIEREARYEQDRPLVASVIVNRLKIGMPLQIDATIQYALGYQDDEKNWWKKSLTPQDLRFNSSYNTYLNTGLPPGPISNPGLSALQAAANPTQTNYLYYISDKDGHNHYAKTLEEHNANIRKYGL